MLVQRRVIDSCIFVVCAIHRRVVSIMTMLYWPQRGLRESTDNDITTCHTNINLYCLIEINVLTTLKYDKPTRQQDNNRIQLDPTDFLIFTNNKMLIKYFIRVCNFPLEYKLVSCLVRRIE